jgi:hypothetical protein
MWMKWPDIRMLQEFWFQRTFWPLVVTMPADRWYLSSNRIIYVAFQHKTALLMGKLAHINKRCQHCESRLPKWICACLHSRRHLGCHDSEHSNGRISVKYYGIIISYILVESSCNTLSHKTKISLSKIWDLAWFCAGRSHIYTSYKYAFEIHFLRACVDGYGREGIALG